MKWGIRYRGTYQGSHTYCGIIFGVLCQQPHLAHGEGKIDLIGVEGSSAVGSEFPAHRHAMMHGEGPSLRGRSRLEWRGFPIGG